jgi:hypothetical protein
MVSLQLPLVVRVDLKRQLVKVGYNFLMLMTPSGCGIFPSLEVKLSLVCFAGIFIYGWICRYRNMSNICSLVYNS